MSNLAPISILVTTHNHAQGLAEALDGLLAQTLQAKEIILVADAATDDGWEAVQAWQARHPGRLQASRMDQATGRAASLWKAFQDSSQPYVYLHTTDDLMLPQCLETYLGLLLEHPQAGLAASRSASFLQGSATWSYDVGRWVPGPGGYAPEQVASQLRSREFTRGQVLFRRELLEDAGGRELELGELWVWFQCLAAAFRRGLAYSPKVLNAAKAAPRAVDQVRLGDLGETLLEILLEPSNASLLPLFAQSGALHKLGLPLAERVLASPRWWTSTVTALVQQNLSTWAGHNDRVRLDQFRPLAAVAFGDDLEPRIAEAIFACQHRDFRRVAFYGAGEVTASILPIWERQGGPEVVSVFTTGEAGPRELGRYSLGTLAGFDPASVDAVILSSRTYELELAEALKAVCPAMPRIGLWHPAHTSSLP